MKKFITVIAMLVCSLLIAQNDAVSIAKSEIFKDKKKHTELVFSEDDGQGGVVTVRKFYGGLLKTPRGYYIEHFDSDLNLKSNTEIEVDQSEIEGILVSDGKIHLFEKKFGDEYFEINRLTSSTEKLDFSSKLLLKIDQDDIKKYFAIGIGALLFNNGAAQGDNDSFGEVTFSKDKNFMAFNFDIKDKDNEVHRIYVFNKNFEKVYEKEFTKNIKDKYFEYENVTVDDTNGTVYFLGKTFKGESKRKKKKGKINYHYELYKISKEEQKMISFETDEHFVASLTTVKAGSFLSCVGFYSEKKESRYKGVIRYNINTADFMLKEKSFQPFTEQFIIDKYGKKKDKELSSLRYRGIFIDENTGDIVLNAEEYFVTRRMNMNMGSTSTYYHYNDIVSIKIDAKGTLEWARNINKKQTSINPSFNEESYTSSYKDGNVYIFLNGSKKVKKIRNDRIEFKDARAKKKNLYLIEINGEGSFDYSIIQTDDQLEVPLYVSQGTLLDKGEDIIFLGRKSKKKQLVKVSI